MSPTLTSHRLRIEGSDVRRSRLLRVEQPGTMPALYRVSTQGAVTPVADADTEPDAVMFGEAIALQAVLGGHLCPAAAWREGQVELSGSHEDIAWLARCLSGTRARHAA